MGTPLKRYRVEASWEGRSQQHSGSESWASWDVDVLDSAERRRKKTTAEAMSTELCSKLQFSQSSQCSEPAAAVLAADDAVPEGMQLCSSAECSPGPTPHRAGTLCQTPGGAGGTSGPGPGPALACAIRTRLPPKGLHLAEQMPTSPSDPQLEGVDLRKATLMRLMILKAGAGAGAEADMHANAQLDDDAHCHGIAPPGGQPSMFASPVRQRLVSLSGLTPLRPRGPVTGRSGGLGDGSSPCSMEASPAAQLPAPTMLPDFALMAPQLTKEDPT